MEQNVSVYFLITNLCEKYCKYPDNVKCLRAKCYDVLLGRKILCQEKKFHDLEGSQDPIIDVLSWNFRLIHEFNLKDYPENINKTVEDLRNVYKNDKTTFNNVLRFLLYLKDIPKSDDNKLDLSSLPPIDENLELFQNVFKLPESLKYESDHFDLENISKSRKKPSNLRESFIEIELRNEILQDEGYHSPTKGTYSGNLSAPSINETCSKKSWESYGFCKPHKEKPFLSELGELSTLWVENLDSLYLKGLHPSLTVLNTKLKPKKVFIRDVKFLLVGMPSETFGLNERDEFFVIPGVLVEGIAPDTLENFCRDFLFSGTCYRTLSKKSTPDSETRKYKHPGYVFTEFCDSLNRYLQFFRTAVLSISDTTNFLTFHEKTYKIRLQVKTLASVCKVGPYATSSEEMPHGVALLNYLYQKVFGLGDQNLKMVLYSILYPCCQVYFSRFLQQWILEGTVNDPYGEFFITSHYKYISTRGRTYWTRSYSIKDDIVPDFLLDLQNDILFCGKTMNMLKLCCPNSALYGYSMSKKPFVFTCCLTYDQLTLLEQSASKYYLEVSAECGSKLSLSQVLAQPREKDPTFMNLIARKRAATLKRIELERQKVAHKAYEKKLEELNILKEQYESAVEQKQLQILRDVEKELRIAEENLKIERMKENLVKEEAANLIQHYTKLFEAADSRREKIEKYVQTMKHIHIVEDKSIEDVPLERDKSVISMESYHTAEEKTDDSSTNKSLDILNANSEPQRNDSYQHTLDNFEMARKNKHKVLTEEMGVDLSTITEKNPTKTEPIPPSTLTDAQRNKLRVLSSEFGIEVARIAPPTNALLTAAQLNRNRVLGVNECFKGNYFEKLDNENFLNRNQLVHISQLKTAVKKSTSFTLDLDVHNPRTEPKDKPIPMSIDSTPISDLYQSTVTTPSTHFISESNTTDTQRSDEDFLFDSTKETSSETLIPIYYNRDVDSDETLASRPRFSKRVTPEDAAGISKNCLKVFLHDSVSIPLLTQMKLSSDELLKFFIREMRYLEHLESLRDYFFLQDGEFGRNITENLYEKLYASSFPVELINCRTLQRLVFGALDVSSKYQGNAQCLSFRINSLPKCFDLGNPDVLDCLSLTYKVKWPLNVLLPTDTIARYDQVFKYLLKLNRVSWVLKKIFLELKVLAKETGKKEIYLMSSPQYRRLHQCRHVMTHFVQTLQNYVVGEVLQPSWDIFEKNLATVSNLDELYHAHTVYIKNILFMCLLNQKTVMLRNVIQKIFVVILKFYDYLRSRRWKCEDGTYIHPNFNKLDKIFNNFEEFVFYFFKVARKVAKSGYQPHLMQLLDVLNVNSYYSSKNIS